MKLKKAKMIADWWVEYLSPVCERVEIAGSIRRKKSQVKDIEIVACPRIDVNYDLFGHKSLGDARALDFKLRGYSFIKNGDRYKQLVLPEGINLDLFIVLPPAQWGVIFTIRTGSAGFSRWLVTKKKYGGAMPNYLRVKDGALWSEDKRIVTSEERDFFDAIGLDWIEPEKRNKT